MHVEESEIGPSCCHIARHQYLDTGFGFVDYNSDWCTALFDAQESYGVALTHPDWLMNRLIKFEDVRVLSFTERDWDDHQDVVVFGKPSVNA